jgi:hypothetical protein
MDHDTELAAMTGDRAAVLVLVSELRLQRPVIEAAKALHAAWMGWEPDDPRLHPVHTRFKLAVEALLAAEGEK